MTKKTVTIYKLAELRPGDVVLTGDTLNDYPSVQREGDPFVPDPEVWRKKSDIDTLSNRHVVAVKIPGDTELYTYYLRMDED